MNIHDKVLLDLQVSNTNAVKVKL